MSPSFNCQIPGKWILTGEHAVLRGMPALVFPLPLFSLSLSYQNTNTSLNLATQGYFKPQAHQMLQQLIERACFLTGKNTIYPSGDLFIENRIPICAGLGASAALCVALAKWFLDLGNIPPTHLAVFAKQLEDHFHGQSSGLDIAAVLSDHPLFFERQLSTPFYPSWKPQFALSYVGSCAQTRDCVRQVQACLSRDPALGNALDLQMKESTLMAKQALETSRLDKLKEAIDLAQDCFDRWGLISPSMQENITALKQAGALAVKPTGSGGGGYLLSLWRTLPCPDESKVLGLVEI